MAIITNKSIVYHVPKCGGNFVKFAMRKSMDTKKWDGYYNCKDNGTVQEFKLIREHATPSRIRNEDKEGLFSFCFVRHPITWYRSYWCYRSMHNMRVGFPLDKAWSDDFEQFVINAVNNHPGFASQMFRMYEPENMDFIGKQETLLDDLVIALTLAGEEFDEGVLRAMPRNNESSSEFISKATISKELEDRIIESEQWVIGKFYD